MKQPQHNHEQTGDPGRDWFVGLAREHPDVDATATTTLRHIELPNRKQEAWKYTNLSGLYQQMFKPQGEAFSALQDSDIDDWVYEREHSYRLVLVNGQFNAALSQLPDDDSVTLSSMQQISAADREIVQQHLANGHEFNHDAFDELNRAISEDGYLLRVAPNHRIDRPIEIVYLNLSDVDQVVASNRSLIWLENGAEARLVERWASTGNSLYFCNTLTRIIVQDNASLVHHRLQQESAGAYHLDRCYLTQHRASRYRSLNMAIGGLWSRSETIVNLEGEGSECDLKGLYTVSEGQYNDMHIDVRHLKPHCSSTEQFKGILAGKGRAVFDGRILVEQDAQKTSAELSNNNLLLSEQAEIDTKPQLEIYADDVKCSHGTTVGRLDPNQLFYCRARGLDEAQAIGLLSLGFAEQVISELEDTAVRQHVHEQITRVLGGQRQHERSVSE
jgi:Fe-S cluster assembly protein SufD